jgi:hypothetical protein
MATRRRWKVEQSPIVEEDGWRFSPSGKGFFRIRAPRGGGEFDGLPHLEAHEKACRLRQLEEDARDAASAALREAVLAGRDPEAVPSAIRAVGRKRLPKMTVSRNADVSNQVNDYKSILRGFEQVDRDPSALPRDVIGQARILEHLRLAKLQQDAHVRAFRGHGIEAWSYIVDEAMASDAGSKVAILFSHALDLHRRRRELRPRPSGATGPRPTPRDYVAWVVKMIRTREHDWNLEPSDGDLRTYSHNIEAAEKAFRRTKSRPPQHDAHVHTAARHRTEVGKEALARLWAVEDAAREKTPAPL